MTFMRIASLLAVFLLYACGPAAVDPVETALEKAGRNRTELEHVMEHYRTVDPDSQKLAAARFLIGGMTDQFTLASPDSTVYEAVLREICARTVTEREPGYVARIIDSILRVCPFRGLQEWDVERFTARELITNIDSAFGQWRTAPWRDRYTFDEFCEWVLPYRIGHEKPEDWRALALSTPREGEDSIRRQDSLFKYAVLLINNTGMGYGTGFQRYPLQMNYSELQTAGEGDCYTLSDFATLVFRSRGVPAATDVVPAWGNRSAGHTWNTIVLPGDTCKGIGYHSRGWLQMEYRLPKVYRRRYSPMRDDPIWKYRSTEPIPPFFGECNMQDITAQYVPVSDIQLDGLQTQDAGLVWLCTFNNFVWVPVAYAETDGGRAMFRDVARGLLMGKNKPLAMTNGGKGIAYLPGLWQEGRCVPAGEPFILYEDGTRRTLTPDSTQTQSVTLDRKYPQTPAFREYAEKMTGIRFQGANRSDFADAMTLFEVTETQPHPFTPCAVPEKLRRPYRYVRCLLPDKTRGNIAELRFYSDTTLLRGRALGTPGGGPATGPEAAFDGDMLTYALFPTPDAGNWAGLDLGRPQTVTNIAYRARTDDNDVWPGDTYELWYWNGGWQSMGQKKATGSSLTWDRVPTGTLYWVRDLTRGAEQRIFTYEKGQLNWW